MLQNNEKTAEVLKAEKIVEQAKARLAEAKRKAWNRFSPGSFGENLSWPTP